VIYADGFLGHVFDPQEEIRPALRKLVGLGLSPGTYLVFSNDAPYDTSLAFQLHDRVRDFWFISKDYLRDNLTALGLSIVNSYYFPYQRPISGMRDRTICVARVL
jgi:hypothetical protein